ncbi:MAG: YebC/PmpR family DNA-binding transcriptional regulator [Patescibacteria group bacterium]|nr:YebC/PmpR family DNA-binding transcriptional regulator [Patescibacteria group bacterium]MDD5715963.1 YebC/PmpR family DNA-binding transcriptional regulator [Patescibacteria group bacterium]
MSGHSKWRQIKRQKAVTDNKRGNLFTKLANGISIAAKRGGKDPTMNFQLRMAIDKAKAGNMPNENIERAIKRGAGELAGAAIEEVTYEGFGPGGTAIIIQTATDNKNRTAGTIRSTLTKFGGNLGGSGSVQWMFQQRAVIRIAREQITDRDALELALIDAGADDIADETEGITVYASPERFAGIKAALEQSNIQTASADIELVPQNKVALPNERAAERLNELLEELEQNDDVSNYFTNADA